VEGQDFLYPA